MSDDLVLVIDGGTSSLRCHLVDPSGRITHSVTRPWRYLDEADASEIARAFDPDACWRSTREAIAECVSTQRTGDRISALAITSQRQSLVFLDARGRVVYAGPNTDLRAFFEGSALDFEHGSLLYRATGHRPTFMMAAGKLTWFRHHRPAAYSMISHVLTLADWLAYKLTGTLSCEPSLASDSGLLNIGPRELASEVFDRLGLTCPAAPLRESVEPSGVVSNMLIDGVDNAPVVVAGGDTQCALIGLGIGEPGAAGIVAGWSATVQMLVSERTLSPDMMTWAGCFQSPRLWTVESSSGDMGNAYRWLAETVFGGGDSAYGRMDELAASASVGSGGAAAYLGPRAMDVSKVGMQLGGIVFPVPLTLGGPSRGQVARATLEGFAYALRANLEQAERVSGAKALRIGLGGGLTRSRTLTQMVPDVLGRAVQSGREPDSTVIGAALVARTATGQFGSLEQAAGQARQNMRCLGPDMQSAAEYDDLYQVWLETQRRLGRLLP